MATKCIAFFEIYPFSSVKHKTLKMIRMLTYFIRLGPLKTAAIIQMEQWWLNPQLARAFEGRVCHLCLFWQWRSFLFELESLLFRCFTTSSWTSTASAADLEGPFLYSLKIFFDFCETFLSNLNFFYTEKLSFLRHLCLLASVTHLQKFLIRASKFCNRARLITVCESLYVFSLSKVAKLQSLSTTQGHNFVHNVRYKTWTKPLEHFLFSTMGSFCDQLQPSTTLRWEHFDVAKSKNGHFKWPYTSHPKHRRVISFFILIQEL